MRRRGIPVILMVILLALACLTACQSAGPAQESQQAPSAAPAGQSTAGETTDKGETMIYAHIGEKTLAIQPAKNSSAEALIALLQEGDVTVDMHDYGNFVVFRFRFDHCICFNPSHNGT